MGKYTVMGLIFANMHDSALSELTSRRAMGSVPFGGRYRLIDFPLSNMVNAGISRVGIITKQNYQSLMDHLGSGKAWDLSRKTEGLYMLTASGADEEYDGRLKPLIGVESFIAGAKTEYVILADSHVVGNIDYAAIVQKHVESGADITVAYSDGSAPRLRDNLLLTLSRDNWVRDIVVGDGEGQESSFGLGLYVISRTLLLRLIREAAGRSMVSFERGVLQRNKDYLKIYGYNVPEWNAPIYSLQSYFAANMALLEESVRQELFPAGRPIYTKVRDCSPAIYGLKSDVTHSLVADGAHIEGKVVNSIIFRDVSVGKIAVVENCIVMQGSVITPASSLTCAILDKNVTVKEGRKLQGVESYPLYIKKGMTV
ncbi:MAG: glucose-1-phosphate adenylyltransferase subunit GlgD [Clostridia bacterium]|nr:glucose-1-phosphate adenylyltransferase subunit GlgD [Clostridia bacterium]